MEQKKKNVLELSVRSRTPNSLIRGFCSSSPHLQSVGFCKNGKSTIADLYLSTDTTGHLAAEDEIPIGIKKLNSPFGIQD